MMYNPAGNLPRNESEASTLRAHYLRAFFARWSR